MEFDGIVVPAPNTRDNPCRTQLGNAQKAEHCNIDRIINKNENSSHQKEKK
jgi:hypothetical protein